MMHPEVEKFLDSIPFIQKETANDVDCNGTSFMIWKTQNDIVAVEYISGKKKGLTSIHHDNKFYNQDEFLKLLKLKAFW